QEPTQEPTRKHANESPQSLSCLVFSFDSPIKGRYWTRCRNGFSQSRLKRVIANQVMGADRRIVMVSIDE
ncbi:MAG: hypothetical protein ACKVKN_15880, partial [Pseudomonadales bacterium]